MGQGDSREDQRDAGTQVGQQGALVGQLGSVQGQVIARGDWAPVLLPLDELTYFDGKIEVRIG